MSVQVSGSNSTAGTHGPLSEFIGHQVEIISMEGHDRYTDVGVLEAYDNPWVNLRKKTGELLCFSTYNIRLIKLQGK